MACEAVVAASVIEMETIDNIKGGTCLFSQVMLSDSKLWFCDNEDNLLLILDSQVSTGKLEITSGRSRSHIFVELTESPQGWSLCKLN